LSSLGPPLSKGKGKQKAISPIFNVSRSIPRIGNPDSGASSDADDDYGVSTTHHNGINGTGLDKGKGKGKGKDRSPATTPRGNGPDGFLDDVEGDDEDLYHD
jgi:hypothetical protein